MPHAFVSYVREDATVIDRLVGELRAAGVETWFDRESLHAGGRWADAIEAAIESGAFFIACFSTAYARREQTYMHEELAVARRTLRVRGSDRNWLVPLLIDGCSAAAVGLPLDPDLAPLHAIALQPDWLAGIRKVLEVVSPQRLFGRCLNELPRKRQARSRTTRAPVLALDFGTSNSLLAYRSSKGTWIPIRDAENRTYHPSVITFDDQWNYWVGREALDAAARRPLRSIQNIKRLMLRGEDVVVDHKRFTPVTLASLLIRHLINCAEAQLGKPVTQVVASTPADFSWFHKEALVRACQNAGVAVQELIPEPNATGAAAISWVADRPELTTLARSEYGRVVVLVIDIGGGTTDVSLEILGNNGRGTWELQTVAAIGDNKLGGMDYDEAIRQWLHDQLIKPRSRRGLRWTTADEYRLLLQARLVKEALASSERATVLLTDIEIGRGQLETLTLQVERSALEPALRRLDDRLFTLVQAALDQGTRRWGHDRPSPIRGVLLGGQSSKVWTIAAALRRRFEGLELVSQYQENAVSLGLARNVVALSRNPPDLILLSAMTRGIGVRSRGIVLSFWHSEWAGVLADRYRPPVDRQVKLLLAQHAMYPTWIGHMCLAGPGEVILEFVEVDGAGEVSDPLGRLRATLDASTSLEVRVIINPGDNRIFELHDHDGQELLDRLTLTFPTYRTVMPDAS